MSSKNKLPTETKVIISVPEAIAKTTNWRSFMAGKTAEEDAKRVPKAVYISKEDIIDMGKQCEADDSIAGVRAYFTLDSEAAEEVKNMVTFVMVLVRVSDTKPYGDDVLYVPSPDGSSIAGNSNVYDYTTPCPHYCDVDSPLFTGIEK